MYLVEVKSAVGAKWTTAKRFSDFYELKKQLEARDTQKQTGIKSMSFPRKKLTGSMKEGTVEARRARLEAWLTSALSLPEGLRKLVDEFLHDDGSANSLKDAASLRKAFAGSGTYDLVQPLSGMGSRTCREKNVFLVNQQTARRDHLLCSVLTVPRSAIDMRSKSSKGHMKSFLVDAAHPYILPIRDVLFVKQYNKAVVFRCVAEASLACCRPGTCCC